MDEQVNIFVRAGDEKKFLTSLKQQMWVKGIRLSRTGEVQRMSIGNEASAVELEIPRSWVPDMILHMALMLETEDTISILRELEERIG